MIHTITMPYYSIDVDSLPLLGCIKINQFIETEKRKQMKSWRWTTIRCSKMGRKIGATKFKYFFFYLGFSQRRLTLSPNVSTSKTCSKSHGVFMKLIKKIPKFEHGRCNDFHGDHSMCNHGCKRFDIYRKNFGSIQRLSKVLILSIIGWR